MREELQEFVDFANSIMPSIKVTVDFDNEKWSVYYLDMTVCIDADGYIRKDLYKRETKGSVLINAYICTPSGCDEKYSI